MQKTLSAASPATPLRLLTGLPGILVFPLVMAVAAAIRIPLFFTPVPITLQTFALFLSIICLKQKAGLAQLLYVLSFNLFYLAGPTGGYLLGFILAAAIGGMIVKRMGKATFFKLVFLFGFTTLIVYSCGIAWLKLSLNTTFAQALVLGAFPFAAGDALKIALAAFIGVRLTASVNLP